MGGGDVNDATRARRASTVLREARDGRGDVTVRCSGEDATRSRRRHPPGVRHPRRTESNRFCQEQQTWDTARTRRKRLALLDLIKTPFL